MRDKVATNVDGRLSVREATTVERELLKQALTEFYCDLLPVEAPTGRGRLRRPGEHQ